MAALGEALLSASVQTLIERLASEFRDYLGSGKLNESLLGDMKKKLLTLQAVLDDAEEKQIKSAVNQWLDQLKDAIFDAEDLLNQISTHSLQCKMENTEPQNITNQVWNFLSSPFKTFYREINSQMDKMCQRLQRLVDDIVILGLQIGNGKVSRRTPSCSMVNESVMVGRKHDKEKLMNILLSDNGTGNKIGVVTILGMRGVGKTTLAQLLYNDKQVQDHFDLKAWACVSEDFDISRVTKTLLESVTKKAYESNNLDFLGVELKQHLSGKRFLIVLDDLWNDKYNDWHDLVTPLMNGKIGSKVIITTRQQKVADRTHTFPIHKLETLSEEDCWSLLSKHAFRREDYSNDNYPKLEAIGKEIAKKCGGLPLAAKTLGGLLRSNVDANEWTTIWKSNIWDLSNDDILPALRLSYQCLPSHLKRCFAYCSIFPKDYPLDRKQLVLLWMAEGFVQQSQGEKAIEEIGDDYFVELLSRSLIGQSNDDANREKFFMHDLVNDLARVVSGKSCSRLECGEISENVRHLSYNRERYDIFKKFENFYKFERLRSFLPLDPWYFSYPFSCLSIKVVDDLLPTLRWLRVLSLTRYENITMLSNSVGNLVQLRYLDLSWTQIKNLPDTTCNLVNLQTLILSNCRELIELPAHIGKLVNLRHLDISGTSIKEMPMQIVNLENLRTLTVFIVGKQQVGLSVKELRKFPHLKGKLSILNLHNVIEAMDACDADLKSKEQIEELVLQWGEHAEDSQTENTLLDLLQPSVNLKKLTINFYGGTSFPSWVGDSSFSNMVSLSISNCKYCKTLHPLGQLPSLKVLVVDHMTSWETIGREFYGTAVGGSISSFQPFPSLERLEFKYMSNWKKWLPSESGEFPFPRLKTLKLYQCPKLKGHLPSHLSSLEEITIARCDNLRAPPPTLHWLSMIKQIEIDGGPEWSLAWGASRFLPRNVRRRNCSSSTLLSLPKILMSSTCLQRLSLNGLPSLTAFPTDGLPTSLQSLTIHGCTNLAFLPPESWCNYMSLVRLSIAFSYDSLTSFPLDGFPALQDLSLIGCDSLESIFLSESSPLRPSRLQSLGVHSCRALRSLPQRMDTLTALRTLKLDGLTELELSFSEGARFPPQLRSISIDSVKLLPRGLTEGGLQHLPALSRLWIQGDDDIVNILLKGRLLPISLVSLGINHLSNMKFLEGNGLQHLTSLEELYISSCPKLESLPEDRLPSSLKLLSISRCPLLEARYESQRGKHCSSIAQIPVLKINGKVTI